VSPPQAIEAEEPDRVRIPRTDGQRVTLRDPVVRADSIIGAVSYSSVDVGMPISDVEVLKIRRPNGAKTLSLVFGLVGAYLVGWIIACQAACR